MMAARNQAPNKYHTALGLIASLFGSKQAGDTSKVNGHRRQLPKSSTSEIPANFKSPNKSRNAKSGSAVIKHFKGK